MGKVSRKDKEKSAWIALGMLIDNLIEEYGFDRVYWLKHLSTSDFVIDCFYGRRRSAFRCQVLEFLCINIVNSFSHAVIL